jgi:hypothetical protein
VTGSGDSEVRVREMAELLASKMKERNQDTKDAGSRQELEKGRKGFVPKTLQKEKHLHWHLDFNPARTMWTFNFQNSRFV